MKLFFFCLSIFFVGSQAQAQTTNTPRPTGSRGFGKTVTILTNGNYVVTDPYYNEDGIVNIGAVYLYNGSTKALISTLKGRRANYQVSINGVIALSNGNYVVISSDWNNSAGAVTWGSGTAGVSGVVSSSNSLVGGRADDQVGIAGITALSNGNYVVWSPNWHNGTVTKVGAVTWSSGKKGVSGVVSSSNSLVGRRSSDFARRHYHPMIGQYVF